MPALPFITCHAYAAGLPLPLQRLPFRYLLLHTQVIQGWAYQPLDGDMNHYPNAAPSVLDLLREQGRVPPYAWVWGRTVLDKHCFDGPLLVALEGSSTLLAHAIATWMPLGGAIALDASIDLRLLAGHLGSLVQLGLREGGGLATQFFHPSNLANFLDVLGSEQRDAWLGPITAAAWCMCQGPRRTWQSLARKATATRSVADAALVMRPAELEHYEANLLEHFLLSRAYEVQALPQHASKPIDALRGWVEGLLPQLEHILFFDEEVVTGFIQLAAKHPWLIDDAEAGAIYNDLQASPEARLRDLQRFALAKEAAHV